MSTTLSWPEPRRGYWEGAGLALAGLLILRGAELGLWSALFSLPGGAICIAAGVGLLLWPGDPRLPQFGALGAFASLLSVPVLALAGAEFQALINLLAAGIAFVLSGWLSLATFPRVAGAPEPETGPVQAAKIAIDEGLVGFFIAAARPPRGEALERMVDEVGEWESWLKAQKLRGRYESLHPEPEPLLKLESRKRRWLGQDFRHISFASGYQPQAGIPGGERWQSYGANRTAHAWVLEHAGAARPWLLTIHGYRMGEPWLDLSLFDPRFLHHRLGLNMASVVLPLHGPRRRGLLSGQGYLEGDMMDFVHAEFQAMSDIRRLLSWLRLVKHAPAIGAYGVSLGGYNTALLAGLDKDLCCAVAGVPVTSMARVFWRHAPIHERLAMERAGIDLARTEAAYAPVSPESFKPRIQPERLGIFAGSIDRLVWPDEPLTLQAHWGGAELAWFDGAHVTFLGEPAVSAVIRRTLQAGGLVAPGRGAAE